MNEMERYIVIPTKYLEFFSESEKDGLSLVIDAVTSIRNASNKEVDPSYIVCKETEPYAEAVWNLILAEENLIDDKMAKAHKQLDEIQDEEDIKEASSHFNIGTESSQDYK